MLIVVGVASMIAASAGATTMYVPQYGYAADPINAYTLGSDGLLSQLPGAPFASDPGGSGNGTGAMSFTPDGTRAVVSYYFFSGLRGIQVAPDGSFAPPTTSIPSDGGYSNAVSPDGKFVYVPAENGTKGVHVYSIGADGALAEIAGSPFDAGTAYGDVAITPDNKFLYATNSVGARPFAIGSDGTLTSLTQTPFLYYGTMQMSPNGRFLFGHNSTGYAMESYAIGSDGSLTAAGSPVTLTTTGIGYFSVAPDGGHLYIGDYNGSAVKTLSVAPDGSLSLISTVDTTPARSESTIVSPDGKFVYAASTGPGEIAVAPLGADGAPGMFTKAANWSSGEFERLVLRPGAGPSAAFDDAPQAQTFTMGFDATPTRGAARYDWDFGDGSTGSGVTATHTYAKAGVYPVTLTTYDANGCSSGQIYTGQTTVCPASKTAARKLSLDTPAWITALKLSKRTASKKTKLKFTLTEAARLTIFVQEQVKGRIVGTTCRKQTASNSSGAKCTLWLRASKSFRANGKKGKNAIPFVGKVGHKALPVGSYRFNAVAKDSGKSLSPVKTAPFKVKR
jgi:PKD repeat protein